jgi:hypothetical protein
MLCHNHYDLMAFATPGESPLWYRQDDRKVSHGHEDVAVIMEPTLQPGHVVNLHAMPCGGNSERNWRAQVGAKCHGLHTAEARATRASWTWGKKPAVSNTLTATAR